MKTRALEQGEGTVSIHVCHGLSVENVCNEITGREVTTNRNQVLANQQSRCAALALVCVQPHASPQKKNGGHRVAVQRLPLHKNMSKVALAATGKVEKFFHRYGPGTIAIGRKPLAKAAKINHTN